MSAAKTQKIVTLRVGEQLFGISIFTVRDMLHSLPLQPIPLAPASVAGMLNMRGKPVTALGMHARLGLPATQAADIMVVVEHEQELVALMVDAVLDILPVRDDELTRPTNPEAKWRGLVTGTVPRADGEVHLLDLSKLIDAA